MDELNMIILIVIVSIAVSILGIFYFTIFQAVADEEREFRRRNGIKKPRFDERQLADRAAAYRVGFLTLLVYDGLYLLLKKGFGLVWCEEGFGIGLGALAGLTAFTVECVRRDAFYRVGFREAQPPLLGVSGLFWLSIVIFRDGLWRQNGVLTSMALIPVLALYCIILYGALYLHSAAERKQEQKKNAPKGGETA